MCRVSARKNVLLCGAAFLKNYGKRKNKRKILLKPCSGFRSIFEKLSKRLSENLYKNQEIEVLEKSIKNYKEV